MKIGNLIALLIVAAGMTCSMSPLTAQATATQKPPAAAAETRPVIDLSKVPLQEGIHEVYRGAKSGLRVFRIVNDGKEIGYFAVDQKGEVLTQNVPPRCGVHAVCFGYRFPSLCLHVSAECPD